MAKKQRGGTAPLREITEGEEPSEHFDLILDSSDDEAPEEVTFKDSKTAALQSMKSALDTAKRERELLKEKRRKRQEFFQEQKKRKLLPVDVLEKIDSASSAWRGEQVKVAKKKNRKKARKSPHTKKLKGNYKVMMLKEQPVMAAFQQQAAEDFIQSRLYGPGSCRTTNNELLSLQNKKGMIKGAAVQFVKKDWACQEKAKAEKIKKRWIHKQQISPC